MAKAKVHAFRVVSAGGVHFHGKKDAKGNPTFYGRGVYEFEEGTPEHEFFVAQVKKYPRFFHALKASSPAAAKADDVDSDPKADDGKAADDAATGEGDAKADGPANPEPKKK